MTGFLMKIILFPLAVYLADVVFPGVYFQYYYQPLMIGLILAVVGQLLEAWLLNSGTVWLNTLADFVAAAVIIYGMALLLSGARVTWGGVAVTALLLGVIEYFMHRFLLRAGHIKDGS